MSNLLQVNTVAVIGSGYLGTQIAMPAASTDYEVKVFDSRERVFGILDKTGLGLIYDIEMVYYRDSQDPKDRPTESLKEKIERRKLGGKSGRGFVLTRTRNISTPAF